MDTHLFSQFSSKSPLWAFGRAVLFSGLFLPALFSCSLFTIQADDPGQGGGGSSSEGVMSLRFDEVSVAETKATAAEKIDTNSFILSVTAADGTSVYSGKYGDSPEKFSLTPGSYVVKVASCEFSSPAFSSPQYGDEQCVVVPSGSEIGVRLSCSMKNCGVRLNIASGFLTAYPESTLFLQGTDGRLLYSYREKRIAFFNPGKISLILIDNSSSRTLMSRKLSAAEVLNLSVKVASSSAGGSSSTSSDKGLSICVDTTKTWIRDSYTIGGTSGGSSDSGDDSSSSGGKGSTDSDALTISQAKASVGEEGVWVSGYIVGGDLTSTNASFSGPFKARSNIVLGPRSSSDSRSSCLSVQLSEGDARDELNLVDNPDMLGRQVILCGDIVSAYYGMVGLKNITDFVIKD